LKLEDKQPVPFEDGGRLKLVERLAKQLGNPRAALETWATLSGVEVIDEVTRRELILPEVERSAMDVRWKLQVEGWAEALGFNQFTPAELPALARAALGNPGQAAAIARSELAEHSHLVRQLYPVTILLEDGRQ